ncbi:recombinase family protein [Pseudomonas syringae]|uniref:recombinase family protein n=1 Tax=Pseudomonas syringae TaxID=317 RepID=UPI000421360F|nr:recombinase family protein [Pseudomonas syringae]MCF5225324.1 serine recombinase [Pseudomonas syringae]MCF5244860.1 serine recombinase [Pseudomonas syringae]
MLVPCLNQIAAYYTENERGTTLKRPELFRLLSDAHPGDVLLVEQVDRLSRLTEADWQKLRGIIKGKEVRVVSLDLPTSHQFMAQGSGALDTFTARMLGAINDMLLDILAAVARKDYEDRRRWQMDGIKTAKDQGAYKGRGVDQDKHQRILECLSKGMGVRETARTTGTSTATVQRASKLKQSAF